MAQRVVVSGVYDCSSVIRIDSAVASRRVTEHYDLLSLEVVNVVVQRCLT